MSTPTPVPDSWAAPVTGPAPLRFRAHGHLWALWDGTPAHAPPGRLTHDAQGRLACHLCGHWFDHLGLHLRRHGWSADRYRAAVGLDLHTALCSAAMSARLEARQRHRYDTDAAVRRRFATGQRMAQNGDLNRAAMAAAAARTAAAPDNPAAATRRRERLDVGRRTRSERTEQRLTQAVIAAGVDTIGDLLRREHAAGTSLDDLRQQLGIGRSHLRQLLDAAGVQPHPTGRNRPESQQARARHLDRQVTERVGTDDLRAWLQAQRDAGATMADLARSTGRSTAWVRARLNGRTTTAAARAGRN